MSDKQVQQCSQPRDISRSPSQELAYSLPDHIGAGTDYFMRNHFLTNVQRTLSLSFSNMHFDGERTIILHNDVNAEDREDDQLRRVNERSQHLEVGRTTASTSSSRINIPSRSCIADQAEPREFYTRELSDYLMIGTEDGENYNTSSDGSGIHSLYKHVNSDESSHRVHGLSYDDDDGEQTDNDHLPVSSRALVSDDTYSNRSITYSQTSSEVAKFKVHHWETITCLSRADICQGISQTSPTTGDKAKLISYTLYGTKFTFYLHYMGLDQDCRPNGSITLTAILELSKKKKGVNSPLDHSKCMVRLTVSVYEESIKENRLINKPRSCSRDLDESDRQRLVMHMTVHDVVSQEAIIFSKRCSNKIYFKIVTEICVD